MMGIKWKKKRKRKKIPIAVVIKPLYIWSGMKNVPTIKRQKRVPLMFKECLNKYFKTKQMRKR